MMSVGTLLCRMWSTHLSVIVKWKSPRSQAAVPACDLKHIHFIIGLQWFFANRSSAVMFAILACSCMNFRSVRWRAGRFQGDLCQRWKKTHSLHPIAIMTGTYEVFFWSLMNLFWIQAVDGQACSWTYLSKTLPVNISIACLDADWCWRTPWELTERCKALWLESDRNWWRWWLPSNRRVNLTDERPERTSSRWQTIWSVAQK